MNKYKILVVEDEKIIAEAVVAYLEKNEYEVVWTDDGNKGLELFRQLEPDMVLLDLMLPGLSGEEICKHIQKESNTPIIMMTAKSSEEKIIDGLNLGADDYITKPFSPRELVARVNSLFRRVKSNNQGNTISFNNGDLEIDLDAYTVKKEGKPLNLTQSEYKLLVTMAKSSHKTFTRDELIEYAFNSDFDGFDRTIDSHIKNLRSKIETDSTNPIYILTIRGVGYKFNGVTK